MDVEIYCIYYWLYEMALFFFKSLIICIRKIDKKKLNFQIEQLSLDWEEESRRRSLAQNEIHLINDQLNNLQSSLEYQENVSL